MSHVRSEGLAVLLALVAAAPARAQHPWPVRSLPSMQVPGSPACAVGAVGGIAVRRTISSGGARREYLVVAPSRRAGDSPRPVLIDLHGTGSSPEQELAISGLGVAATARGFVVVAPQGTAPSPAGHTWNVPPSGASPDDARFIEDVLDDVARQDCVERTTVFLAGFSAGGRLASHLACALDTRVVAIAVVGGLRRPVECGTRAVSVLAFHGTADPINPYGGGGPAYWRGDVESAFRGWIEAGACAAPTVLALSDSVDLLTSTRCRGESSVTLYRLRGHGHTWPGSAVALPEARFGRTSRDVDASERIARFFARLAGPPGREP